VEDLECDGAVVLQIAGEIDRGHPAAPELTLDRVPAREGRPHALGEVGHVAKDPPYQQYDRDGDLARERR